VCARGSREKEKKRSETCDLKKRAQMDELAGAATMISTLTQPYGESILFFPEIFFEILKKKRERKKKKRGREKRRRRKKKSARAPTRN
jgi:hypothetical protein